MSGLPWGTPSEKTDGTRTLPALLMLAAFLEGTTTITVRNPGEKPWIGLTLHWLDMFGVRYTNEDFCKYTVTGPTAFNGFTYTVPADWSSAAFPIAAALVTRSEMTLENVDFADPQGDKGVVEALEKMGASFTREEGAKRLRVHGGVALHGAELGRAMLEVTSSVTEQGGGVGRKITV